MLLFVLLISLLGSYLLTPMAKRLAFILGAVDKPNKRRVNVKPIPNLGGLAIYAGVILGLLFLEVNSQIKGIMVCSTLIVGLGLIDDLYELSALTKLLGQIIIVLILTLFGIKINFIRGYYIGILSIPVTLIWMLGTINTINLIDGLDGLAGGITVISAVPLAIVAYYQGQMLTVLLTVVLIGATLGFLRYNFNPAQIFMGDTGSMFLGFMLGVIAITGALKSVTVLTFVTSILALGIPIFDTLFAILRRKLSGKSIFKADKNHLHHQLLRMGLNQWQAVVIVYLISVFLGLIAVGLNQANLGEGIFLLVMASSFLLVGARKSGFFNFDSNKYSKY
ncbi:UDP-N-acetylmuramyl pentapeptide phosphotransferase/UDP-N-acetylglucosamine-1-phosphate transferase [Halobacteroides halobius DSM 5150]|uniref:UDP-N-acetylmuramyl pentapeptide phosphotransferase/UDP-N-acetylglucosamine-1-phosphate transferase n=1 Tax=Halobacteroides halobius (strain ATCC 35273 / DSM 5150 / MD-1) TaxID=748449 RepID=L0KAN5_HALHC|nr:MraY family glycosyltransferase [Halobacteroides halobius]AGB42342.1 UDP-N-acetylmuramyl pentapeptide phosphotransferase/UDP-N-acetylglucosamine-1-phosphate transferase [Halobacteroides halobius DSM 5150]